jgi:hypothetical protein
MPERGGRRTSWAFHRTWSFPRRPRWSKTPRSRPWARLLIPWRSVSKGEQSRVAML